MPIKSSLAVEDVPISELLERESNSNEHSPDQVSAIGASIQKFGFVDPILIDDDNCIIAGHGTRLACLELGMEKVPCIRAEGLSEIEIEQLQIALNVLPRQSHWNTLKLGEALERIKAAGEPIESTGFSPGEAHALLSGWVDDSQNVSPNGNIKPSQFKIQYPPHLEDDISAVLIDAIAPFDDVVLL